MRFGAEAVGSACTRQCITFTPALRAAGSSRLMLGSASRRAASARTGNPAFGPTTRALEFLGDDRGVFGCRELGKVDRHAEATASFAGTS